MESQIPIKYEPMHTTNDWEVHFNMDWLKKMKERNKKCYKTFLMILKHLSLL